MICKGAPKEWLCDGRPVKLFDDTTLSMPHTPDNQANCPQQRAQLPGLGFPIARLVIVVCLATGAVINAAMGPNKGKATGELALLMSLLESFEPGDIVIEVTNDQGVTSDAATVVVTKNADTGQTDRISSGLLALYSFSEGAGSTVLDVSGVGAPLDLTLMNFAAAIWGAGTLTVNTSTSIVSSGAATKINFAVPANNAITLEAWVIPGNKTQTGPARIIGLSTSWLNRNITLG